MQLFPEKAKPAGQGVQVEKLNTAQITKRVKANWPLGVLKGGVGNKTHSRPLILSKWWRNKRIWTQIKKSQCKKPKVDRKENQMCGNWPNKYLKLTQLFSVEQKTQRANWWLPGGKRQRQVNCSPLRQIITGEPNNSWSPVDLWSQSFAVCQLRVCILQRPHLETNYVTTPLEGSPHSKAPPNAAHKCSFLSLVLEHAQLLFFVVSHIPRFFAFPKKKKEREKMATLRGVTILGGPGRQKSWCKDKTSGDANRKCSKG